MKKITILLILLLTVTFSYSQLIYVETFGINVLPTGWTMQNVGDGTHLWTFGSNEVPGDGTANDFTGSAAIFDDDTAGNTGNRDNVILWTGSDAGGGFDFSIYPDGIVTLSYEYALNVLSGGSETLSVVIWDNTNTEWITLVEYNTDTNPTLDSVDITAAISANSGINPSAVFIGFEYDDIDGGFAWGAGIDNVRLRVAPENDNCWTATNVTNDLPYQDITRTSGNTNNGYVTPAGCGAGMNNGLWYTFTAQVNGEFNIESLTPDFDHEIGVYLVGDCFNPASFVCIDNADAGGSGSSETLSFNAIEGVQYFINIGYFSFNTYLQTSGDLDINMFYSAPANDDCANAEVITDGATETGTTLTATDVDALTPCEDGGGDGSCTDGGTGAINFGSGVWYKYTSTSTETITISTANVGTDYDTELQVWSGACGALTCVGGDDDGGDGTGHISDSQFCWQSTGSSATPVDYYIYVDGHFTQIGNFVLTLNADQSTVAAVPANNECANAEVITDGATETGTTIGATANEGIVDCGLTGGGGSCGAGIGDGNGNYTEGVFYVYTSTSTETITISTENAGTNYDTELSVWSGACGAFVCVGSDDDSGDGSTGSNNSELCWLSTGSASNPVDYYIQVSGFASNVGNFELTLNTDQSTVVSTEDFEQFGFSIYPNPVNNILSIDSQEIITKVSIFNLLGQEVKTSNPETNNVSVDVNNLDSGVYIVKLVAGDKKSTKKFIKK